MSPEFYRILHFTGLFATLSAVGAQCALALSGSVPQKGTAVRKTLAIIHGIGLLAALVAGFGLLAKLKLGFPGWAMVKLVVWLYLGAAGSIALKRQNLALPLWLGALVLVCGAALLALYKPF